MLMAGARTSVDFQNALWPTAWGLARQIGARFPLLARGISQFRFVAKYIGPSVWIERNIVTYITMSDVEEVLCILLGLSATQDHIA
jgi:hypothetical protein